MLLGLLLFTPMISLAETSPEQLNKIKLENVLSTELQIQMDFSSNTTFITHTLEGFIIEDGAQGFEIKQSEMGPSLHNLDGNLLISGDKAKQVKRLIISVLFQEPIGEQQHSEPSNDNHPPPCRICHPAPPGSPTPPDDPEPNPPEDDECDPSTDPDGCECPQEESTDECDTALGGGVLDDAVIENM